jgi:BirA family transcriptional regulator, biotin operon repressor / biotin---[acetyl-CoA-carboxylase] ligase
LKAASLKRLQQLVVILSDGQFHSGEYLAEQLGVSRTAIWKLINKLQSWQIAIFAVRGKGYKIPDGLTLIDSEYLRRAVGEKAKLLSEIKVLPTVDSTSSYMTQWWKEQPGVGKICISEHQTAGRGRKGRKWVSPFGANLYFSIGLSLPMGLSALGGLSLAVGIGLTKLLNQYTDRKVSLKWPNDILVDGRKLAGILVEASGDSTDNSFLNIGIGINWAMDDQEEQIDQPWANLKSVLAIEIDRNQLLTNILLEIDQLLDRYIEQGFQGFRRDWAEQSAFYGRPIVLHTRNGMVSGVETGVDRSGAIIIKTSEGDKSFYSGEVSLRAGSGSK